MNPWTINQLNDQMAKDLEKCHTEHERIMVKAINGRHIREQAHQFAQTRKLTPGEIAIATQYGYKPQQEPTA